LQNFFHAQENNFYFSAATRAECFPSDESSAVLCNTRIAECFLPEKNSALLLPQGQHVFTREVLCCSVTTIAELFLCPLQYMEVVTLDNHQCENQLWVLIGTGLDMHLLESGQQNE